MSTTKRPQKLTAAEKRARDDIIREMKSRGIDPDSRAALLLDYIKLDARISRLSEREADPELGSIQVSRAVNVAIAERRRLHDALFAGAAKLEPVEPPPTPEQIRDREAYTAWAHFFERLDDWADRSDDDRARHEAELTLIHGEPPMRALVLPRELAATRESVREFYEWMDAQAGG